MHNVKHFKVVSLVLSILFFMHSALSAGWKIIDMGDAGRIQGIMNGVVVDSLRPDGIVRVYASNSNTHIYEFTFSSASNGFIKTDLGTVNAQAISALTTGDGRHDGTKRMYVAARDSKIYELTPTTGTWALVSIGAGVGASNYGMLGVTLGDGRGDGTVRVYGSSDDAHLYEFTYSGGVWNTVDMGTGQSSYSMNKVAVGPGRNDGVNRVFAANNDSAMYEYTWTGTAWVCHGMGRIGSSMRDVAVGNGRNDGVIRVYGGNLGGRPFEYSYSNSLSTWTICVVDNARLTDANSWLERITLADGRNDGVTRLYGADHDSHLYEYSYGPDYDPNYYSIGGSTFTKSSMGYCSNFMQAVAAGNGRNDGMVRIYAGNYNYHLYEFSYTTSTLLSDNQSNNNVGNSIVYPTFANLSAGDKINFANFTPNAHITIITLAGHTVRKLQADANGVVPAWDGTIENGGKAASGTYIVHVSDTKSNNKVFKILLIK
jgi:hypothetical protein